jgi:hypothetical protein
MSKYRNTQGTTLVLGGVGKTGRRVAGRRRERNAELADGAQRAGGRELRNFADYARRTAAAGVRGGAR